MLYWKILKNCKKEQMKKVFGIISRKNKPETKSYL